MVNFLGTIFSIPPRVHLQKKKTRPKCTLPPEKYCDVRRPLSHVLSFFPFTNILRTCKNCSVVLYFRYVATFEGLKSSKDITVAVCLVYVLKASMFLERERAAAHV